MPTETNKPAADQPKNQQSPAILVFATVAETTWRLFVPIVLGCVLGVIADRSWNIKPIATISGILLGVIIAGLLIKQQLGKKF